MTKTTTHTTQSGFFDLGLSLVLLTMFGTTTAIVASNQQVNAHTQLAACSNTAYEHETEQRCE